MKNRTFSTAVPRGQLVLVAIQVALALLALLLDLLGTCGSCARATRFHIWIAAAGVLGYSTLLGIGLRGRQAPFFVGLAAAAGVHTALVVWMWIANAFCIPCVASALVAAVLLVLAVVRARGLHRPLLRAYVPALVLASIGSYFAHAEEGARDAERQRDLKQMGLTETGSRVRVTVFELPGCRYCREFRDRYLPRLKEDFGERLEISFVNASETKWVRWAPTIVISGGSVFQGLPKKYERLKKAIRDQLPSDEVSARSPHK